MNLISNNCVGARMYELSNKQFNNPFTWCAIDISDFVTLIKNFNKINFYNIKIYLEYHFRTYQTVCAELDDIKLHYVHYIYKDCDLYKNKPDVLGNTIIQYFTETYYKRLNRMIVQNEQPTFLLTYNYTKKTNKKYIECLTELIKLNNKNIYIFAHNDNIKNIKKYSNTNLIGFDDDIMNLSGIEFSNINKHYFFNE